MFEELFERFKKKQSKSEKTLEELQTEFERVKAQYANIANSDLYKLFIEYFSAKIELNRDAIEEKNPLVESELHREIELKAENRVMKAFIEDIEDMKKEYELEHQES